MSKAVTYLRPNIPRILINRNILRVPTASNEDFLFHACLLGNCGKMDLFIISRCMYCFGADKLNCRSIYIVVDDVVEVLGLKMMGDLSKTKSIAASLVMTDGAWLGNHPKESVLLFPGAEASRADETQIQQCEIVYCDGCHLVTEGSVYSCTTCFDYDLCSTCYPTFMLTHADGKHVFRIER